MSRRPDGTFRYDGHWRKVRKAILARDGHVCQIRGPNCQVDADQVDHVVPVADGGSLYDPENLRASCRSCNTGRSNRQKARHGWRRSSTKIVLVVGPPGAGKSTVARERSASTDLVVDYDEIARALGSSSSHGHSERLHGPVMEARNAVLRKIREGEVDVPRVWIVSSNPAAESVFPHHEVVEVDPGRDEVLKRCREAGRPREWVGLVDDWYASRKKAAPVGGPSREW